MQFGPLTILRTKALDLQIQQKALQLNPLSGRGGWWSVIREPYTGAWQRNDEVNLDNVLTNPVVFACTSLIAGDIGKIQLLLVEKDANGIWSEVESPAFSPFLREPNHFQTQTKFIEQWLTSKLIHGNTYMIKKRDQRGVIVAGYILDPTRVTPMVAENGDVYYELKRDDLSRLRDERVIVPASEVIHDRMVEMFHPLIGVSPLFAAGLTATQGLSIHKNSSKVFSNASIPGGVLTAPGAISNETAHRAKTYWESEFSGDNVGKIAVLGDGLEFKPLSYNAVDLQLIDQLKMTGEMICTCYKVPPYMVGIGPYPPYANIEPMVQQYYSQCLQSLMKQLVSVLDKGFGLLQKVEGRQLGFEFDIDDLIWLDNATRSKVAGEAVASGLSFNEVRKRYWDAGPVKGGESPMAQQQMFSLEALARRDQEQPAPPTQPSDAGVRDEELTKMADALLRKELGLAA